MITVKFEPEHLHQVDLQPSQAYARRYYTDEMARELACYESFTAMVDGKVIACAGLLPMGENEIGLWSVIGEDAGPHMVALTRAAKAIMNLVTTSCVTALVEVDFSPGHRWMAILGFSKDRAGAPAVVPDGPRFDVYKWCANGGA